MHTVYRSNSYIPELVLTTKKLAKEYGFTDSCTDEFGRLLRALVGPVKGSILEIGTGFGVSTSWIVSSMSSNHTNLISIDKQQNQINAIAPLFSHAKVEFIASDWKKIKHKGPIVSFLLMLKMQRKQMLRSYSSF
ncbi:hypothetical protein ACFW1P_13160 [Paenibacillus sp. NPDC058910]|uniref:hypothetical protein n=1 Tax=unclassified Paenibacillus TaxID=185978 RepID=UPI0036BE6CD6